MSDFDELLRQHDVEFIRVKQSGSVAVSGSALVWRLRALKPNIVHANMMKILAAILRPLLGVKLVTTVHNEFQKSAIAMRVGQRVIGVSEAVTQSMIRRGVAPAKMRTVPTAPERKAGAAVNAERPRYVRAQHLVRLGADLDFCACRRHANLTRVVIGKQFLVV